MALIDKTIYPVLPNNLPQKVIAQHYTLNVYELEFTVNKTLSLSNQIYEEMFMVAISVKEGKVKPSGFLNKIAYCGGHNKLYLAFRELGRALRSIYILKYICDFDLRKEANAKGFQIDLIFERADRVMTVCEIKYLLNPVASKIINDFENKIALCDYLKDKTIHKVLITASEPENSLKIKAILIK